MLDLNISINIPNKNRGYYEKNNSNNDNNDTGNKDDRRNCKWTKHDK